MHSTALTFLVAWSCTTATETPDTPPATRAPAIFQLADHLAEAKVEASPSTAEGTEERWSFTEAESPWHTLSSADTAHLAGVELERRADRWSIHLDRPKQPTGPLFIGGLQLELEPARIYADYEALHIRARTSDRFAGVTVITGQGEDRPLPAFRRFFGSHDDTPPLFSDGSTQTYAIPLRPPTGKDAASTFDWIAILAASPRAADLEILDVALVPRGATYDQAQAVVPVVREGETRRTLYAHTDSSLTWSIKLPDAARLDVGLTALPGETVAYRLSAQGEGPAIEHTVEVTGAGAWVQESLDLAPLAGQEVALTLSATGPGRVAFWGAPIVSGKPGGTRPPNVIFYVIDGGGADFMSLYGYGRSTTPKLEALAKQGVVFERAYSNATWTQPSTASFMTSLHHSVLGGLRRGVHSTPIPDRAVTFAERMRQGGYQTASFTSNPNAGRIIGIERGMDVLDDSDTENPSTSSPVLHQRFWDWRTAYPGGPWWVHFQTTDVHEPSEPPAPFAGTFGAPDAKDKLKAWHDLAFQKAGHLFGTTSILRFYEKAFQIAKIDRRQYYSTQRDLYDETMAHQDTALAQFVDELKAKGEWENTILVIGADHGHPAGTFSRFGRGLLEPQPEPWEGALFDSYATHVPLVVVWPGHIEGGRRIADPVSMIDVLPTVLDLAGLPAPEVLQGRSLAPLLRGQTLPPRPVILDEFRVDEATGAYIGNLDIVDGNWGASLEIGPVPEGAVATQGRRDIPAGGRWGAVHPFTPDVPRLLLYDLATDRFATKAVNDAHPDLVAKYEKILLEHWQANQALGQRFSQATAATAVTPDQLEQLKALGYVQ